MPNHVVVVLAEASVYYHLMIYQRNATVPNNFPMLLAVYTTLLLLFWFIDINVKADNYYNNMLNIFTIMPT